MYIPPPSVKMWCPWCKKAYWYVPGVGTFRCWTHRGDVRDLPVAFCQDHIDIGRQAVAGHTEIVRRAEELERYYERKYGGRWRR